MTVRRYLCPVVKTQDGDRALFKCSIGDLLESNQVSYVCLDLRTLDEQRAESGLMLVTCDVPDALHVEIGRRADVDVFDRTMAKGALDAIIGAEANDERFDSGKADEYLVRVHTKRRERFLRDRKKA